MKLRYIAALAIIAWYLMTPPTPVHRAPWITPMPPAMRDLKLWEAQHRAEVAIEWNPWVFLVPHVKGVTPTFILDKNVPDAAAKGIGKTGICVWVDKPENVRWVERWVPAQLDGVPVVVEANSTKRDHWLIGAAGPTKSFDRRQNRLIACARGEILGWQSKRMSCGA